jgi:hypothetical protein
MSLAPARGIEVLAEKPCTSGHCGANKQHQLLQHIFCIGVSFMLPIHPHSPFDFFLCMGHYDEPFDLFFRLWHCGDRRGGVGHLHQPIPQHLLACAFLTLVLQVQYLLHVDAAGMPSACRPL